MRPLELTPSGVMATIAVFLVAAVCMRLGLWQLDRRGQRLERNAAVAERLAQPVVHLTGVPSDTVGLAHRRVTLRGRYDTERTLVLAGRSLRGSPGVNVLAPLRIGEGAVLVNRGWLPSRDAATVDLAPVAVDTTVAVTGVLVPFPDVDGVEAGGAFRRTWFRLDGAAVRGQYPYPVAALYVQLEASGREDANAAGSPGQGAAPAPLPLPPPALDAGPHLSYALQWFSFGVIFVVGWAALVMRRGRPTAEAEAGTRPDA